MKRSKAYLLATICGVAILGAGSYTDTISIVSEAEAKYRSSSSSFSRSSSRSSYSSSKSSSRSSYSSYKSKAKPTKAVKRKASPPPKPKPKPKPLTAKQKSSNNKAAMNNPNRKKSFASVRGAQQTASAKSGIKRERSKFKSKPVVTNSNYSRSYGGNSTYRRAGEYDRSTYHTRRNSYYSGYQSPQYVYNSSPSFGMWDTIFLYSILSSANSSSFHHNHSGDKDYLMWRREADKQALENRELRAQLDAMDSGAKGMKGKPDPSYLPPGVDADIALSQEALLSTKPVFNACSASSSGTYYKVLSNKVAPGTNVVHINVIETEGTRDNLAKIADGTCDGGLVQSDGYWNYLETLDADAAVLPFTKVASLYKESMFLMCNVEGPDEMVGMYGGLSSDNTIYLPHGSGAAETWENFVAEDGDWEEVKAQEVPSYERALISVQNDPKGCTLYVGAQGHTRFLNAAEKSKSIQLIDVNDTEILDTKDPAGRKVYTQGSIALDKFPSLARSGSCFGNCAGDIETLNLSADFVISNKWAKENPKDFDKFALEILGMKDVIAKEAGK